MAKERIEELIDDVVEGASPSDVLDETMTPGMRNAYKKAGPKYVCKECGLPVPRYHGRYPCNCPECKGELVEPGERDDDDED